MKEEHFTKVYIKSGELPENAGWYMCFMNNSEFAGLDYYNGLKFDHDYVHSWLKPFSPKQEISIIDIKKIKQNALDYHKKSFNYIESFEKAFKDAFEKGVDVGIEETIECVVFKEEDNKMLSEKIKDLLEKLKKEAVAFAEWLRLNRYREYYCVDFSTSELYDKFKEKTSCTKI